MAPRALGAAAIAGAISGALMTDGGDLAVQPASAQNQRPDRAGSALASSADRLPTVSRSQARALDEELASGLRKTVAERDAALGALERRADRQAREIISNVWVLPMSSYRLTGTFGETSRLWATVHTGLDFAGPTGSPILAIATGSVTEAGWAGAYGYRTIVTLPDGTEIWYCHQSRINVSVGDRVARGQPIGEVGSTGNVTGPHLHLEVRPGGGSPVDPKTALQEHRATP